MSKKEQTNLEKLLANEFKNLTKSPTKKGASIDPAERDNRMD